jgi:hypothetical protein
MDLDNIQQNFNWEEGYQFSFSIHILKKHATCTFTGLTGSTSLPDRNISHLTTFHLILSRVL